ncbi:hypothetical protein [Sporosarcina globispora]|uniref:hypothetical protein n=1 Tax=Sporosarcina globispora TaxID=1459 RepID=UPI000AA03927|nr:hypothetical protein [Sporosarcina globispora]
MRAAEEQKSFVAPKVFSLARLRPFRSVFVLAIFHDDVLAGFTMYCMDFDDKEYWVYRLMIGCEAPVKRESGHGDAD